MGVQIVSILIALSVSLLAISGMQALMAYLGRDKKRLTERLGGGSGQIGGSARKGSIILNQEAEGLSGRLAKRSIFARLNRSLALAYPETTLAKFLTIAGYLGVGGFVVGTAFLDSMVVGLVCGALMAYVPFLLLMSRRIKRQKLLAMQLPEALDFLSRILKAGHSLGTGLQMMGDELPKPLAEEFRRAYDQHSLGMALEDALRDMVNRIDSTDFAFFVTAVLIQRQTGGDLSEVLGNISGMIRQRIRLQQHVKAKTAEGRFTGYILVAFPAVMFVISYMLNPKYAGVLLNTSTGIFLLCTAFGLQVLGLIAIQKITKVEV